ncbi:hypothetical protein J1614_007799 [Plenodomus biglobosus]|nr:hypothetical protein J1614_007799 [Plenodomus biglobosus]
MFNTTSNLHDGLIITARFFALTNHCHRPSTTSLPFFESQETVILADKTPDIPPRPLRPLRSGIARKMQILRSLANPGPLN